MFLFRCCLRVDCGCQNEPETEASRSSHSSRDYLRQSEKQIQCRLLPQPVDVASAKHFVDYSGCSHTVKSHSLLVGSAQSVDYEEVLLVSVPSEKQSDELLYADVSESVVCKPPCSIGIVNNNFSPDVSVSNNNLLQLESLDNAKSLPNGGPQNGSDESHDDVSSASSSIDDDSSAEVKYVADIRQFQPTQTSIRPHGEECCCTTCLSANDGFSETDDDQLVHDSNDLKCSCKSCTEFYCKMHCGDTGSGFAKTVGGNGFINRYGFTSSIAQDSEDAPLVWSHLSSELSAASRIAERDSFHSRQVEPAHEGNSVSLTDSERVSGVIAPEKVDDDNGLFSSDDELHYVFHKFIGDSCLEEPLTDASTGETLRPEYSSARSADDLEVAFFMFGNASSAVVPDASYVTGAVTSAKHHTPVSEATAASAAEFIARSCNLVTEPSLLCSRGSSSNIEKSSEQYSLNVVFRDMETDPSASSFETNAGSEGIGELKNASDALRVEASEMVTDSYVDSDLNVLESENNQTTCSESDGNEVRRGVIVQQLSDTSSFIIELHASADEHISDLLCHSVETTDISTTVHTDVTQEHAPAELDVIVGQSLEIVTPECIIEHPVSIDEAKASSQGADDVSYQNSKQSTTADVTSYICEIVANAVQQIADDADRAAVRICTVATEDEDDSSNWPKQILITSAPVPSSYNELTTEDEYDKQFDSLPTTAAAAGMEPQFSSEHVQFCTVEDADISILHSDVHIVSGNEAITLTATEPQEVPQSERYLISYDVHPLQQPVDDDADTDAGKVKLTDLVWPLEHAGIERDVDEMNVDSEGRQSGCQDADEHAAEAVTLPPTDIVEDFFMQYVLPVDSVAYSMETHTAAVHGEQHEDVVADQEEHAVQAKQLESTAQAGVDIIGCVVTETDADSDAESAATSAVHGLRYKDIEDQHKLDWDQDDENAKQLETTAGTIVDIIINEAVAETDADVSCSITTDPTSSPTAAGDDTQLVVPTRASCLLQSPSEPHRKKSVHFADMHGLQLETVQHYKQSPETDKPPASLEDFLSKLSAAAADRRAKWTEHHPSRVGASWLCNSSVYLLACFELPSSQEELLERVRQCRVALESCSFDDLALAFSGVVRVANIAFHKTVLVRYTVDGWTAQTDVQGEYIPRSNDGPTDRFSFTVILPSRKQFVIGSEVEFAVCFVAGDGPSFEFWDNNHGHNYVVRCCSKAASSDVRNVDVNTDICSNDNDEKE